MGGTRKMSKSKLFIVDGELLPEIFLKVIEAKEYLQTGQCATVGAAAEKAGISRSAFYKYKNGIMPFRDMKGEQVVTMSLITHDKPGVLSGVLSIFADSGANILTINQSIPTDGVGMVTLSITTEELRLPLEELFARVEALPSVVRFELLAG